MQTRYKRTKHSRINLQDKFLYYTPVLYYHVYFQISEVHNTYKSSKLVMYTTHITKLSKRIIDALYLLGCRDNG